ncbi:MAG: hypothetical protein HYR76_02715 [Ignavibacteria bacterium]|nr:hypothetical protein [Ignavibacteria bacterium]
MKWSIGLTSVVIIVGCGGGAEKNVVVIEKTKSVHTQECSRVYMARTKKVTIDDAKKMKFRPCPDCKPFHEM